MPLSEMQLEALRVFDWFFSIDDAHRATGRTFIHALALIRLAARHPGRMIEFPDDHAEPYLGGRQAVAAQLRNQVVRLIRLDPRIDRHLVLDRNRFCLNLPAVIPDWIPDLRDTPAPTEYRHSRSTGTVCITKPPRSRWERLRNR